MEAKVIQTYLMEAQEVENIVREHLAAFGRGDFDAWGAAFAPDVFFTAADPEEVFLEREAAIAEMHKDFDPAFDEGLQIEVEPLSFHAGVASDCNAAWNAAPLRYGINFQEETSSFVLRHTSVLTKSDPKWSIRVTHYSLTLPEENILQAMMTGNLPAPHPVGDSIGVGAQALVEVFKYQLADLSGAASGQDEYIFGPFPGEQADGKTAVRALFAKWTSTWCALRLRPGDGLRAELVPEAMGWVGANVEAVLSYGNQHIALPL